MLPAIQFRTIWFDDDVVELEITSSDAVSFFCNKVYIGHLDFEALITGVDHFKNQVFGGIFDLRLGEFGPEYAGGAFHARLHFQDRGKIFVTAKAQGEFKDFGRKNVANEAILHLVTEPALLDAFIVELRQLKRRTRVEATLHCVGT